jgi:hypothetical protein
MKGKNRVTHIIVLDLAPVATDAAVRDASEFVFFLEDFKCLGSSLVP